MQNNTDHIKEIIKSIRKEKKLKKGLEKVQIKKLWIDLWGEHIAQYTEKIFFENGKLTVYLTSSALREEINRTKFKIIEKMNDKLGEKQIKKIILK